MDTLTLIKDQFQSATSWTSLLVDDIPKELWLESREPLNTNINWLVGHILVDKYFHAVVSIIGDQPELKEQVPLPDYIPLYNRKSNPPRNAADKPEKVELLEHLGMVDEYALKVLDTFEESGLTDPTIVDNPVADTKYDALMWCFKHQMWHNGQIAMLKRILLT